VAVDRGAAGAVEQIAGALREVGERDAHHVVFAAAEPSPYYVQFTTDPGVFWGEVVSDRHLRGHRRLGAPGAARLEALGWRPPAGHIPNWFQYFQPTRKRHYRDLAEHVLRTFRAGLRENGEIRILSIDRSAPADGPTFVADPGAAEAADGELLELAALVLGHFGPAVYDSHLELTIRRKRHRVRVAVSACDGTVSCAALHLPAATPELVDATFQISDRLERVPYTYALRTVTGHGESLVLLSKFSVMPELRNPGVMGLLLYTTIEPLVAAHRALHAGSGA
jgi:hypothetical protein